MAIVETEGLILKSYNLSEADKIVVLLTRNEGLIRGVAKGAKRLKSRFGGSLEPFSIVNISYFQKEERELVSINQIELVKSFFDNAGEPHFFQQFSYLSQLIVNFAPPHDPDEKLYRMAKICLEAAALNPNNLESIALYFELWILRLGGYLPDWSRCDNCKNEFMIVDAGGLQSNFQLLCGRCRRSNMSPEVSPSERKIFMTAQRLSPFDFVAFAEHYTAQVKVVSSILKRVISNVLGKELSSENFLSVKP